MTLVHETIPHGNGVFAKWQPVYAERGIATFPCTSNKTPAVRNYGKFGVAASTAMRSRFPDADAFGFMCGKSSGITVLDVDSTDERILADAIDRHGKTPIVARSGSGKFHAWYRHNGERRRIRPRRDVPIDILGGGYVVAPPSHIEAGQYQFIQGSLDDVGNLPALQNVPSIFRPARNSIGPRMVEGDGRNNELFRIVGRAAHSVDDFDQLLDYARTQNEQFGGPMQDAEVYKLTASIWKYTTEGRNRFGQYGAYVPLELSRKLARTPDAYALYGVLKAENGPDSIFPIANGMAETAIGLRRYRLSNARKTIIGLGLVEQVTPQTRHKPAMYRWPKKPIREGYG
jgi:Bifunctional DNA primase/polymerase, N-terminal/Primase C terminal 1 (PriCT-1)